MLVTLLWSGSSSGIVSLSPSKATCRIHRTLRRSNVLVTKILPFIPDRISSAWFSTTRNLRGTVSFLSTKISRHTTPRTTRHSLSELSKIHSPPWVGQNDDSARSGRVRWLFVQASYTAVHTCEDEYLSRFYNRLARKKNSKTAIVATARKLLVSMYHMLDREEVCDPPGMSAWAPLG